jgi:DTW domain-containing protein YfiP
MPLLLAQELPVGSRARDRCYACFRPACDCFCDVIPTIENKTEVLILQHMRERFHPFNTARIVHLALENSSLLVDHTKNLAARLALKPGTGLLYPGPDAALLSLLPADQRPRQLVVLDGTWHHAKTLLRDIPLLHSLPRYKLAPTSPSRYRIRREPSAAYLSTVEATVAALRVLEPETSGWNKLLEAFDLMVERQLAHPKSVEARRRLGRQSRSIRNIPQVLLGDLDSVVVAYGESAPGELGCRHEPQFPVYWVAQRLGTGERFACLVRPEIPLADSFLNHLELTSTDFSAAVSPDEARSMWRAFQRPTDYVAVYNQGTERLLRQIGSVANKCLVLKSVDFHPGQRYGSLDELVAAEGLAVEPASHPGRAGKRLAKVTALVRHLNAMGQA